jgi:hypothetical protein
VTSPTQRSLASLRADGWACEIVEHWSAFSGIRKDLFGFIDILCVKKGEPTLGVQTTSGDHVAGRQSKIHGHPNFPILKDAGWRIIVHGWKKPNKTTRKKWECRVVDVQRNPEAEMRSRLRIAHVKLHTPKKARRKRDVPEGV